MEKQLLREIVLEQKDIVKSADTGVVRNTLGIIKKYIPLPHAVVISGIRRAGKSTLLMQIMKNFYDNDVYYFNFEDERLLRFGPEDFNSLCEVFLELYGEKKVFFFDEIQNVRHWEVFIRRMPDAYFPTTTYSWSLNCAKPSFLRMTKKKQ